MSEQSMIPDLPYPDDVIGTYKPEDQTPELWFRQHFANSDKLVTIEVVRIGARNYSLNTTLQATGIAYAVRDKQCTIYPFHEAPKPNDDDHNFFWQSRTEDENPPFIDSCPLEVLMELSPAATPEAYKWRRACALHYPQHVFSGLHAHLQLVFPKEGTRWRLCSSVDRFPDFIAEPGLEGTLNEVSDDQISLKLDTMLEGAQEWENCLLWTPDNTDGAMLWEFLLECEPISEETTEDPSR